jgi:hypothetical protein
MMGLKRGRLEAASGRSTAAREATPKCLEEKSMNWIRVVVASGSVALTAVPLAAQERPDFSGVWRQIPAESRTIGGGGPPSDDHQVTWLVDHRDPDISVVVNVRDPEGLRKYSFRCTTDGRECVNELPALKEVRRMTAVWKGHVLVMSQHASTPHGDFEARDRLMLQDSGERLVFERVVINERGERTVRQVFRKLGPHPSQQLRQDPPVDVRTSRNTRP